MIQTEPVVTVTCLESSHGCDETEETKHHVPAISAFVLPKGSQQVEERLESAELLPQVSHPAQYKAWFCLRRGDVEDVEVEKFEERDFVDDDTFIGTDEDVFGKNIL